MSAPATSGARVVRNTLVSGLGGFAGMGIGILLTPFLIAQLGLGAYGVWTLALTLTFAGGYAALADLGMEAATARYVAEALADGDLESVERTVSTTAAFFAALGVVIAAVMVALSVPLTHVFSVGADLRHAAMLCFAIVGGQVVFELPSRAFVAVLEGAQQFTFYQAVEVTRALLQAALWVAALLAGMGIVAMAAGLAFSTLVVLVLYWRLAHRAVPGLRLSPARVTRAEFRRLFSFGGQVMFLRLSGTVQRQMDKVILGVALTPAAVAIYEVANKVNLLVSTVQSMSVSALLPTTATSRREPEILRDLYLRGTCYTTAASLALLLATFAFAPPLITDWIGEDAQRAGGPARLFLVYLLFVALHNVGSVMVVALGRLRTIIRLTYASVLLNLVVSIALVGPLEIEGVILGTLAGAVLFWPLYLRLYLRTFDVSVGHWLRRVALPNVPPVIAECLLLGGLIAVLGDAPDLAVVALAIAAACLVYAGVFVLLGLGRVERAVLLATLRAAVRSREVAQRD